MGIVLEGRKVKVSKCLKVKFGFFDVVVRGFRSELFGWRVVKLVFVFVDDFLAFVLSGRKS